MTCIDKLINKNILHAIYTNIGLNNPKFTLKPRTLLNV